MATKRRARPTMTGEGAMAPRPPMGLVAERARGPVEAWGHWWGGRRRRSRGRAAAAGDQEHEQERRKPAESAHVCRRPQGLEQGIVDRSVHN